MKEKEYSPELIAELEELFPEYTEAHNSAKKHSLLLKNYLEGSYSVGFSADTILTSISLEDLQKEARLIKRRQEFEKKMFIEWQRIANALKKEYSPKMGGISLI
jgi:hypothetical protein